MFMLIQGAASSLKQLLLGGTIQDYGLACWTLNASALACAVHDHAAHGVMHDDLHCLLACPAVSAPTMSCWLH